jgi:hypothetical protein
LLAKRFLVSREGKSGYWQNAWGDFLSANFEYWGPTTGPLSKQEFIKADAAVNLDKGFPDMTREFYGFVVDPVNYNRVWYTARSRGTHTGPLPPVATTATGKVVVSPPQACSLTFGEDGLITKFTDGYVMDRTEGNTGGLGGLYGVYNAIGKPLPFPEAQPYRMSKRQMLHNAMQGDMRLTKPLYMTTPKERYTQHTPFGDLRRRGDAPRPPAFGRGDAAGPLQ